MSMDASAPYILFDKVEVRYSELVYGLRSLSLSIAQGEFVFFVGPTGAGKSTVLKLLTREVRHTSGLVQFAKKDLGVLRDWDIPLHRRHMGIVPQDFGLLPRKRVFENVGYAMRAIGKTRREVRHKVPGILESVNIGHRDDAFPSQLSGGEQQRVAIARALINDPMLIVADEPTGNLDPAHSMEIMDILRRLNDRGVTVLVASHDMAVVEKMQKRVVTLHDGEIVSDERAGVPQEEPVLAAALIESEAPSDTAGVPPASATTNGLANFVGTDNQDSNESRMPAGRQRYGGEPEFNEPDPEEEVLARLTQVEPEEEEQV
ncbi:MAG: ATP-binding cassette domain-containing protein [Fimbriimonadaceae bacterium]|nr:ATP-binding cassette domain-containing protein [Fimbriimonadaceae bacterium]